MSHNGGMRGTRLGIGVLALVSLACDVPSQYTFESGSAEDLAARYVAEWGGQVAEYRGIFETEDCRRLSEEPIGISFGGTATSGARGADYDTPEGREQVGYLTARRERLEQLGCTEEPPPLPPR